MELKNYLERIDLLSTIGNNWDGYDGLSPIKEVVDNSKLVLNWLYNNHLDKLELLEVEDIYPTSYGTIDFSWYGEDGKIITSIEVGKTEIYCFVPKSVGIGIFNKGYIELNQIKLNKLK